MIPAHIPAALAREVRLQRAFGANVEQIAWTIADELARLTQPAACLACVSRRRRRLPVPCAACGAVTPPSGLFRWREPFEADHGDLVGLSSALVAVKQAPDTGSRSDRPHGDHQAAVVADVDAAGEAPAAPAPPPVDVDDWEYGAWWPVGAFDGQLVVGG